MSGLYEDLPFDRGCTYGVTDDTLAVYMEGKEYIHQDKTYGTGMFVKVRCCRNNSGATLLGKRAAKFNLTAGKGEYDVAGYCTVTAERTGIIDDLLPPTGVPDNDLFWLVISGPCLARTAVDATNANVAVGDWLIALTAATTGATTAGRVYTDPLTGATSVLAQNLLGIVGQAMSAATTGNTNSNILINAMGVGRF